MCVWAIKMLNEYSDGGNRLDKFFSMLLEFLWLKIFVLNFDEGEKGYFFGGGEVLDVSDNLWLEFWLLDEILY